MSNNSFTAEEMLEMDKLAEEMRLAGHNGTSDYYSGGWRCHNACRACEEEDGRNCLDCGACWWESHAHDCLLNPDNQPENCPMSDIWGFGCGPCKNNNNGCGRQKMFPNAIVKNMDWDGWHAVKSFSEESGNGWVCFERQSQQGGWELWVSILHPSRVIKTYSHSSDCEAFDICNIINTTKVRRRIEDALRKNGDVAKLLITAALYSVKV